MDPSEQFAFNFDGGEEDPADIPTRDAFSLRPYQEQAVAQTLEKLQHYRSTILLMPTGCGKTVVFSELARRWQSGHVLVIAHRDELIQQARAKLAAHTGLMVGVEQADYYVGNEPIVVASVQTLSRPQRLERFSEGRFGLIIVDECHHAVAPTYRRILDYFSKAKVVGVTATADRADEIAMGNVFDSEAFVYDTFDAIRDGWLCNLEARGIRIDSIDLSNCRTVGQDFNQEDLDKAMMVEKTMHGVVDATIREAGDRLTLVFTTGVANAERTSEIFNRNQPGSSRFVSGETPIDERRRILADFAAHRFQRLVNCNIATEGFDCPPISCIAMARPTKSRALCAQMVGRGLRPHPTKPDGLLVLEFTGNLGKHSLSCCEDVLGGNFTEAEVELAKKIRAKQQVKPADALMLAREQIDKREKARIAAMAAIRAKVSYSKTQIAFQRLHLRMDSDDSQGNRFGSMPSQKQLDTLTKFKVPFDSNITRSQASRLLGAMFARMNKGLASYKQVEILEKYGVPGLNVKFQTASRLIDEIAKAGWKTPRRDVVYRLTHGEREPGEEG